MSKFGYVGFKDNSDVAYGFKTADGKPRISTTAYLQDIAEGNIANHSSWTKIGYTPTMTTTESDLWAAAGVYVFPTSQGQMEVVSSNNTQDIGTVIKTGIADSASTTTTLTDVDVNFTTATSVAIGDCIILDKTGSSPEWGFVTGVSTNTLTVSSGFSSGGNPSGRTYYIVDKSAYTGSQVLKISYLTSAYVSKTEIIILNGTTAVPTIGIDLFRINSFSVIAAGTNNKSIGNISIRGIGAGVTYSYIALGYTRARSSMYTVPAGQSLYVVQFMMSYAYASNSTHYARLYTRANIEPETGFNTGSMFYSFTEALCSNSTLPVILEVPTKLPEKTDIKISGISTFSGVATVSLRGWLETN